MKTIFVTGIGGNLGERLLLQLGDFDLVGVDLHGSEAAAGRLKHFERIDLGEEAACAQLVRLLRSSGASAVVHLAFVIDPVRTGVLDKRRMWQINVAGTARVMEAIAEVNRSGGKINKFIYPSSVSVYGSDTPGPVNEDYPLAGHTLAYAIHKRQADQVVRERAPSLGACSTYILRAHIFAGATMQNYLIGALRGTPTGKGPRAAEWRAQGRKLPMLVPRGDQYLRKRFQFLHVDDMARLIAWLLRREHEDGLVTILNVAGRGEPLTLEQCARIAKAHLVRLPTETLCGLALRLFWELGLSGVPPEALPYIIGSYLMDTSRLRAFLGSDYENVIRFTVKQALADSFATSGRAVARSSAQA